MNRSLSTLGVIALIAASTSAQNFVTEGDFEQGGATWTRMSFNDPLGTTGFAPARVLDQGPSPAVFASFQTLTPVMSATWRSLPFTIPVPVPLPVGFAAMWEKQVMTPIPYPSVNRVELRILDVNLAVVTTFTLQSPNQTGLLERAVLASTLTVTPGTYSAEVFLRHSNLAGIPFICSVDDVHIGGAAVTFIGQGCAGTGGFVPTLHATGTPSIGNANFAIQLFDGYSGGLTLCTLGLSDTVWGGGALPFPLGGGCDVLVDPLMALLRPITGTGPGDGRADLPLGVPNSPALVGGALFTQWITVDPAAANPYGLVTTSGMRIRIQL